MHTLRPSVLLQRWCAWRHLLLSVMLIASLSYECHAQRFSLSVYPPTTVQTTPPTLRLYTSPRPKTLRPSKELDSLGRYCFRGQLSTPVVYAELLFAGYPYGIPLFIEDHPMEVKTAINDNGYLISTSVVGSLTNTTYRFVIEQCTSTEQEQQQSKKECIEHFIRENPTAVIAAALIYNELSFRPDCRYTTIDSLYQLLHGAACSTYHYRQLTQRLQLLATLEPGQPLPLFDYPDSTGTLHNSDALPATLNILLFYDTRRIPQSFSHDVQELHHYLHHLPQDTKPVNLIKIPIDRHPKQWDSPMIQRLDINYSPHILIVDAERHIVQRHVYLWQLPYIISNL